MSQELTEHLREMGDTKRNVAPVTGAAETISEAEPIDLPDKLPDVIPFQPEMLPEPLRAYALDAAERMNAAPDFTAVALMTSLGSLLGRKVAIAPKRQDAWHEFPNLWGMCVGRPAAMKSPSLTEGMRFLKRLGAESGEGWEAKMKMHRLEVRAAAIRSKQAEKKALKVLAEDGNFNTSDLDFEAPPAPKLRRFETQSANFASLHALLIENSNGLLLFNDELAGLLGSFEGDSGQELKALLLQLWAGTEGFTSDRIGRGMNLHLPPTTVSILGGTQPGRIAPYVRMAMTEGAGDDGFLQRFSLLVWPDAVGEFTNVDRWPNKEAKESAWKMFAALADWTPSIHHAHVSNTDADSPALLRFDPQAAEMFEDWRYDLERLTRSEDLAPALESHLIKYRKAIPALALLYALATDPEAERVNAEAINAALLWDGYLRSHARRFYGAGAGTPAESARAILKRLKKGDLDTNGDLKPSPIARKGWAGLTDLAAVAEGLRLLEDHHWLIHSETRNPAGGRPSESWRLTNKALAKLDDSGWK